MREKSLTYFLIMSKYPVIITQARCGKHGRGGEAIQIPTDLKHELGLAVGDHLTISATNGIMIITKDFKCRVCQKYTNLLSSRAVLAADGNQYYSLDHCRECRDIPDYSRRKMVRFVDLPKLF